MSAEHPDPLDGYFLAARARTAPDDLVARLLAAVDDPEVRARSYWAEAADIARVAVRASAVICAVALGLALLAVVGQPPTEDIRASAEPTLGEDVTIEALTIPGGLEAQWTGGALWLEEDQ